MDLKNLQGGQMLVNDTHVDNHNFFPRVASCHNKDKYNHA